MGKMAWKTGMVVFLCATAVLAAPGRDGCVRAETKPEYRQDVPLDEAHFPDVKFREQLAYCIDANKDGILSVAEREKIYYVSIGRGRGEVQRYWYQDMEDSWNEDAIRYTKDKHALTLCYNFGTDWSGSVGIAEPERVLDVTGIEYFFQVEEVMVDKYEMVSGSFYNNANLKKIWVRCSAPEFSRFGRRDYDNIRQKFPLSRMTYIHLEDIFVDRLDMRGIPDLQVLRVVYTDGDSHRLSSVNLTKNSKLKELEFGHILPGRLDLRKNPRLKTLKLYAGERKTGEKYGSGVARPNDVSSLSGELYEWKYSWYEYYVPDESETCRVLFPKKNQITTLHYFTGNKSLDLSMLTKLENFQALKATKVKVRSDWIRRTFTKEKWGCAIVKSGKFVKKVRAKKKRKFTFI